MTSPRSEISESDGTHDGSEAVLTRKTPVRGQRLIHDVMAFRQLIEYERDRADRSGRGFTVLRLSGRDASYDQLEAAIRYLIQRIRSIDEIGWIDANCLGVLLPYTPTSGAWKVADDTLASLNTHAEPPYIEVLTYAADGENENEILDESSCSDPARASMPLESAFCQGLPIWKRSVDVLGAIIGLVLLSPLFLLTALVLKLTSPGPVFFKQNRSGLGGRPFAMYKFRTMVVNAHAYRDALLAFNEQDGPAFKIKKDPRIIPLGRLLRSTSIDELPQLWNVLRGDMSLVGPRPLPCFESAGCASWQRRRLDITPGMTCIWQVRGRSQVSFDEWMRMDLQYRRNRTLLRDLKLLLLTLPAVLLRRGAR
jgi:lipopolysaccharide/colanic/teichoic acid biosynthesis glycosyltransferase